jgi:hypothetical protein
MENEPGTIINNLHSWKDLLENYIQNNYNETDSERQERKGCEELISYIGNYEGSQGELPKFFYKKPMVYNDLYFAVKSEAKSRFLSNKSYEIPIKQSKAGYNFRFTSLMAGIET